MQPNLVRMIQLVEDCFDVANDPDQLAVDEAVLEALRQIHPGTVGEEVNADGPYAWMLVIPTTRAVMEAFLAGDLNERELFEATHAGQVFEALYLCSAIVLPEFRRSGVAHRLGQAAIEAIQADHPIRHLYAWTFTPEGRALAESLAAACHLPLGLRSKPGAGSV